APTESNSYFRVVVVGSAGVGKSTLVQRWVRGTFRDSYLPTIEDTYRQLVGGQRRMGVLQITDATGGQRYPGLKRMAIARGHAFILVYSVTRKETLEELKPFYELIREIKGSNLHKFPIVLVGNRNDEGPRELALADGAACAQEWNCAFMETSAKEDINVQELFRMLLLERERRRDKIKEFRRKILRSRSIQKTTNKEETVKDTVK
uniref:Uncharacterized protein n=1 Tax=Urocitellus parryii TaxID=9999 RepID=A0A8D2HXI0_UROPR